jgi:hypothetical protein
MPNCLACQVDGEEPSLEQSILETLAAEAEAGLPSGTVPALQHAATSSVDPQCKTRGPRMWRLLRRYL